MPAPGHTAAAMQVETGRLRVVAPEDSGCVVASEGQSPSPGRFIREQRRRRGLSVEQLAATTKIPPRSLELLEADQYDALPGPVFVKGFLRCAARALGLETQVVMDLLYEQERQQLALRRQRPTAEGVGDQPSLRARGRWATQATGAQEGILQRLTGSVTSPSLLLWLLVVAFVALLVLAAFNLMGSGAGTGPA